MITFKVQTYFCIYLVTKLHAMVPMSRNNEVSLRENVELDILGNNICHFIMKYEYKCGILLADDYVVIPDIIHQHFSRLYDARDVSYVRMSLPPNKNCDSSVFNFNVRNMKWNCFLTVIVSSEAQFPHLVNCLTEKNWTWPARDRTVVWSRDGSSLSLLRSEVMKDFKVRAAAYVKWNATDHMQVDIACGNCFAHGKHWSEVPVNNLMEMMEFFSVLVHGQFKIKTFGGGEVNISDPHFCHEYAATGSHRDKLYNIVDLMSEVMDFTWKSVGPKSHYTGHELDNGTWVGIIGDIGNEVTFTSPYMPVTRERLDFLEFAFPITMDRLTFKTRRPDVTFSATAVLHPFCSRVWILLGVACILTAFVFKFISKTPTTLLEAAQLLIQSAIDQPTTHPSSNPARVTFLSWVIFSYGMGMLYKSKLVEFLTTPTFDPAINRFETLAQTPGFQWGTDPWTFDELATVGSELVTIIEKVQVEADMMTCMTKAAEGNYACITLEKQLPWYVGSHFYDSCGRSLLHTATDDTFYVAIGMPLKKGSLYRSSLQRLVSAMVEAGLVRKWARDDKCHEVFKGIEMANQARGTSFYGCLYATSTHRINMWHMTSPLWILSIGFFLSFLLFLGEIFVAKAR